MTILSFPSQRAKRKEKERQELIKKKMSEVSFFPGSLEEYQKMVNYEVEIIDTGARDKGIKFLEYLSNNPCQCIATKEIQGHLVTQGIEAIVNCAYRNAVGRQELGVYYGLPVRKKTTEVDIEDAYKNRRNKK